VPLIFIVVVASLIVNIVKSNNNKIYNSNNNDNFNDYVAFVVVIQGIIWRACQRLFSGEACTACINLSQALSVFGMG
jgi:hypothetical protein